MKSGKDIVFYFRPDVISFTWRGKKIPGVLSPHHPFFPMFLKPYFSCPLFGRENPRISLNNAFPPSFSPLYIIYNNVS